MAETDVKNKAATVIERELSAGESLLFSNDYWELEVELRPRVNPFRLLHKTTGRLVADQDYCYSMQLQAAEGPGFTSGPQQSQGIEFIEWRSDAGFRSNATTLTVVGRVDFGRYGPTDIVVNHSFTLFDDIDRFEEQITLVHRYGRDEHVLGDYRFGFRKILFDGSTSEWRDAADTFRLGAIPFRRRRGHTKDYLREDYTAAELVPDGWKGETYPGRSAEAWSWGDGASGIVISKYAQHQIEFSIADGESYTSPRQPASGKSAHVGYAEGMDVCLRFGGAGRFDGAPGERLMLSGSKSEIVFGPTTIEGFSGSWEAGHRKYAQLMRAQGHGTPQAFNPPVHWNELYELSWRGGTNARLQELPELWEQAELAQAIGAEAFYFDPVWDVSEGSSVWDEERLGSVESFVQKLRENYGLRLSLHLMMHTKSLSEDPRIYRRRLDGEIAIWKGLYSGGYICAGSPQWQDLKTERLLVLAEAGVTFFMFDFNDYRIDSTRSGRGLGEDTGGPCYSSDHGHSVPMTLEEHARGIGEVIARVKRAFPDVLIEAHDEIAGGLGDYLPLYYQHGQSDSYDEHWGFEFMWNCYMDLLSGKGTSLYEYNLAYDIPLYLHINLQFDNRAALAFWWYASTCRHLGIGGIRPGDGLWETHLPAMEQYRRLKPHFTDGEFVGLDRFAHAHVLRSNSTAVIVAFNLSSQMKHFEIELPVRDWGASVDEFSASEGMAIDGDSAVLSIDVDPLSPLVIELQWGKG